MSRKIEVDTKTFIRFWLVVAAIALLGLFVVKAAAGLILVGISIFLAIAIWPLAQRIDRLDRKKKRPKLTASLAYLLVVAVVGFSAAIIAPVVINETTNFAAQAPQLFEENFGGWEGINDFGRTFGISDLRSEIYSTLQDFSSSLTDDLGTKIVNGVGTIANIGTSIILVLVLTLLFLLEGPALVDKLWSSLKKGRNEQERRPIIVAERVVSRMAHVVSTYVSNQVIVALLDGCVVTLAVFVLSIIFGFSPGLALPMGLVAAIFYLIPMFGPFISCAIVSLILAFNSPIAGAAFLIFYIAYAQIENNLIAPKIQGGALNLSPVIILSSVTIGIYVFGLLGAIISIPIAGCIKVLIEEYPRIRSASQSTPSSSQSEPDPSAR